MTSVSQGRLQHLIPALLIVYCIYLCQRVFTQELNASSGNPAWWIFCAVYLVLSYGEVRFLWRYQGDTSPSATVNFLQFYGLALSWQKGGTTLEQLLTWAPLATVWLVLVLAVMGPRWTRLKPGWEWAYRIFLLQVAFCKATLLAFGQPGDWIWPLAPLVGVGLLLNWAILGRLRNPQAEALPALSPPRRQRRRISSPLWSWPTFRTLKPHPKALLARGLRTWKEPWGALGITFFVALGLLPTTLQALTLVGLICSPCLYQDLAVQSWGGPTLFALLLGLRLGMILLARMALPAEPARWGQERWMLRGFRWLYLNFLALSLFLVLGAAEVTASDMFGPWFKTTLALVALGWLAHRDRVASWWPALFPALGLLLIPLQMVNMRLLVGGREMDLVNHALGLTFMGLFFVHLVHTIRGLTFHPGRSMALPVALALQMGLVYQGQGGWCPLALVMASWMLSCWMPGELYRVPCGCNPNEPESSCGKLDCPWAGIDIDEILVEYGRRTPNALESPPCRCGSIREQKWLGLTLRPVGVKHPVASTDWLQSILSEHSTLIYYCNMGSGRREWHDHLGVLNSDFAPSEWRCPRHGMRFQTIHYPRKAWEPELRTQLVELSRSRQRMTGAWSLSALTLNLYIALLVGLGPLRGSPQDCLITLASFACCALWLGHQIRHWSTTKWSLPSTGTPILADPAGWTPELNS